METEQKYASESAPDSVRIGERILRKQIVLGHILSFSFLVIVVLLLRVFFGWWGFVVGLVLWFITTLYAPFVIYKDSRKNMKSSVREALWYGFLQGFYPGMATWHHDWYFEKRRRYITDPVLYKVEENKPLSPQAKKELFTFILFIGLFFALVFLLTELYFYSDTVRNLLK